MTAKNRLEMMKMRTVVAHDKKNTNFHGVILYLAMKSMACGQNVYPTYSARYKQAMASIKRNDTTVIPLFFKRLMSLSMISLRVTGLSMSFIFLI